MKTRSRVSKRGSQRYFTATARKTKAINIPGKITQRGGTRL